MVLWIIVMTVFLIGLKLMLGEFTFLDSFLGLKRKRRALVQVEAILRELEETLMAGLVPEQQRWNQLKKLPEPWASLTSQSLAELRASGGELLPTLLRLRSLAEEHGQALEDARAKSAQALVQSFVCGLLVPLVGSVLYLLLPSVQQNHRVWFTACGAALLLMVIGVFWILRMAEAARWGGLRASRRSWILGAQCAGERFLALVRIGTPADLAWVKVSEFLSNETGELATAWGHSIWDPPKVQIQGRAEEIIITTGIGIRKAVQVSLMEGRPCLERVETTLRALRQSLKAQVERELALLGTQSLKPLFICIAPSILGLLFVGLWLSSLEAFQDSIGVF